MKNVTKLMFAATAGFAALSSATAANAAVIVGNPVNGLATFTDTNTGYSWLKLNDFSNMSFTSMSAAATAAGFTVATLANVQGLLSTLPLNSATFASYKVIMGSSPSRELLWGAYGPVVDGYVNWAYAFDSDSAWNYTSNVAQVGANFGDMGIFAYKVNAVAAVPEAATWTMMIAGFGMMGAAMRTRRRSAKVSFA